MAISQSLPTTDPAFHLNFQGARRLDPRVTFSRASIAAYVDEDGLVKTAGVNQARFTYDPATGESLGLLIEESRTNYLFYSNMLRGWAFGTSGDAFTASSGSQLSANPDGSSPAYHYVPSTNAGRHRYNRIVTVPTLNTNYVVSLFVKRVTAGNVSNLNRYVELEVTGAFNGNTPGTGHTGSIGGSDVTFDLQTLTIEPNTEKYNGYVGGAKIEQYPNGWYRLSYIFNPGTGSNFTGTVWWGHPNALGEDDGTEVGNGNPSFYFWGAQVELGTYPTSHISTPLESAITRSEDIASFTSQEISSGGTLLSLGGGSPSSPASYNSSWVDTSPLLSNPVIVLNSQLSDSSTIPTLLYYPEPISGEAIRAMRAYAPIVKSGLVLHLDAGVDKSYPNSGTTWWDLSGQGNNGALINGPTYNGGNGGSLNFDGTNQYADFFASNLGNIATIEMWAKVTFDDGMLFGWNEYCVWTYSSRLAFNTANADQYGISSATVSSLGLENNWKHYIFEMRSDISYTNNKIYVNGIQQTLSQLLGSESSGNRNFSSGNGRIASRRSDTAYSALMQCSSFRVYNRALTATEVLQNFNASRSRFNI